MSEETLKEEVQEQIETEEVQEVQEQEQEVQEEQPEGTPQEEFAKELEDTAKEISKEDPAYQAGIRKMQEQMQQSFNKRVSKEVSKRKSLENQFNQKFDSLESKLNEIVPKEKPLPKREDFDTDEQWVAAMIDKKYGNKVQPQGVQQQQALPPIAQEFTEKEVAYFQKHPDYYNNIENLKPFMNPDFKRCLFRAGPEIADYISQNIHLAEDLSTQHPSEMGWSIARIEDNFKRTQPLPKRAKPKAEPVTETGATTSVNNIASSSQWDYNRQRAKMDGFIK